MVSLLATLAEVELQSVNRRGQLLTLQDRVTELQAQSRTWLQAIEVASDELRMRLFNLGDRPLWAAMIRAEGDDQISERVGGALEEMSCLCPVISTWPGSGTFCI